MLYCGNEKIKKFYVKGNTHLRNTNIINLNDILDNMENISINKKETEYDVFIQQGEECKYDHTCVTDDLSWEPEGEYILLGQGRDNIPQFKINGTGNTTFIGSVFTFGFLINPEQGGCITYKEIKWEEFNEYIEKMTSYNKWRKTNERYINFVGHEQTAQLLGINMNRITIRAKPGDKIIWAQYQGPRLEEGSITVPENAKFTPMKAEIYDNKMMQIVNNIKALFIK